MKVHLLIVHYKESYNGEHAPNVMLAADEFIMEENPTYWTEHVQIEKDKVGSDAAAWAEIVVEVETESMLDALYPARKTLAAPVVKAEAMPGLLLEGYNPLVHNPRVGLGTRIRFEVADGYVCADVEGLDKDGYVVTLRGRKMSVDADDESLTIC